MSSGSVDKFSCVFPRLKRNQVKNSRYYTHKSAKTRLSHCPRCPNTFSGLFLSFAFLLLPCPEFFGGTAAENKGMRSTSRRASPQCICGKPPRKREHGSRIFLTRDGYENRILPFYGREVVCQDEKLTAQESQNRTHDPDRFSDRLFTFYWSYRYY